jgi:hypothetical protein
MGPPPGARRSLVIGSPAPTSEASVRPETSSTARKTSVGMAPRGVSAIRTIAGDRTVPRSRGEAATTTGSPGPVVAARASSLVR